MNGTLRGASPNLDKTAGTILLRNVAKHDWGFFSREDPRLHLQTRGDDSREGPEKVKFWLENWGRRTFELATGNFGGAQAKALERKVADERGRLEVHWVVFMLKNGWLDAKLRGSAVTLTAYPGDQNTYERTFDLKQLYPGAYRGPGRGSWSETPPLVEFDLTNGLLAVGPEENLDEREHIEVCDYLFTD